MVIRTHRIFAVGFGNAYRIEQLQRGTNGRSTTSRILKTPILSFHGPKFPLAPFVVTFLAFQASTEPTQGPLLRHMLLFTRVRYLLAGAIRRRLRGCR